MNCVARRQPPWHKRENEAMAQTVILSHPRLGQCRIERVEGMNWIIRVDGEDCLRRVPVARRSEFSVIESQEPTVGDSAQRAQPEPAAARAPSDKIRAKRMFESMRTGLPPAPGDLRRLAVGVDSLDSEVARFLEEVPEHGAVRIIRGGYGHGKSVSLRLLEEDALEMGFLVAHTEIDASENQLNKPHHVYRDLMSNLRIPAAEADGVRGLARLVQKVLYARPYVENWVIAHRHWLEQMIECEPLAWLLSDYRLVDKPQLLGLLAGDTNVRAQDARAAHMVPGKPQDWPHFTAGTQGDFASYVISGLSKLARLLGYKGLIVIIDEMEKWQDLNWRQQTQAGNLIGGLIWAATGKEGDRFRGSYRRPNPSQPDGLTHSLRCGGYPFTTDTPCHLGLVIAMTPRGTGGPEELWRQFGPLEILDLPVFTTAHLHGYLARVAPDYRATYDLPQPDLPALGRAAINAWKDRGDGSARTAVQSVIQSLDAWRASLNQSS